MSTPLKTTVKVSAEPKADRNIRWAAAATVILLAASAGILSYDALRTLAIEANVNPHLAFLFPITIDGLILSGSLLLLFFATKGKRSVYGLFLTALGVTASTAGNVAVSPATLSSQLVHAASPIVLFLSLEALTIILRWKSKVAADEAKEKAREQAREEALEQSRAHPTYANPSVPTQINETTAAPEFTSTQSAPVTPVDNSPLRSMPEPRQIFAQTPNVTPEPTPAFVATTPAVEVAPIAAPIRSIVKDDLSESDVSESEFGSPWDDSRHLDLIADDTIERLLAPEPVLASASTSPALVSRREPVTVSVPMQNNSLQESDISKADAATTQRTTREQIADLIKANPSITVDAIADSVEGDRKYVRKLAREELAKSQTS